MDKKTPRSRLIALLALIEAVRLLLSDRKNWTQYANAKTKGGAVVEPRSDLASCWCLQGAALAVTPGPLDAHESLRASRVLHEIGITIDRAATGTEIMALNFNDTASHKQVIGVLDRTMERLAAEIYS